MHRHRFLRFTHLHLVLIVNDVNPMDNGVDMHYRNFVPELNFSDIRQQRQQQQQR
jgi:hypothetical protein